MHFYAVFLKAAKYMLLEYLHTCLTQADVYLYLTSAYDYMYLDFPSVILYLNIIQAKTITYFFS